MWSEFDIALCVENQPLFGSIVTETAWLYSSIQYFEMADDMKLPLERHQTSSTTFSMFSEDCLVRNSASLSISEQ